MLSAGVVSDRSASQDRTHSTVDFWRGGRRAGGRASILGSERPLERHSDACSTASIPTHRCERFIDEVVADVDLVTKRGRLNLTCPCAGHELRLQQRHMQAGSMASPEAIPVGQGSLSQVSQALTNPIVGLNGSTAERDAGKLFLPALIGNLGICWSSHAPADSCVSPQIRS